MTIVFTIIFILSIAGGAAWGYFNQLSVLGYVVSLAVAGFAGSTIIAFIFIYLYFTQDPAPEQGEAPVPPAARIAPIDPNHAERYHTDPNHTDPAHKAPEEIKQIEE